MQKGVLETLFICIIFSGSCFFLFSWECWTRIWPGLGTLFTLWSLSLSIFNWLSTAWSCQSQNVTSLTLWKPEQSVYQSGGNMPHWGYPAVSVYTNVLGISGDMNMWRMLSSFSNVNCAKEKLSVCCLNFCDGKLKRRWRCLWRIWKFHPFGRVYGQGVIYLPKQNEQLSVQWERSHLQLGRVNFQMQWMLKLFFNILKIINTYL